MKRNDLPFKTDPDFFRRQVNLRVWFWFTLSTIVILLSIALTISAFYCLGVCPGIGALMLTSLIGGPITTHALKKINDASHGL